MIFKRKRLENILEECIIKNQQKFYRLAFIYVKNPQDAMDIVQDSILKAYSKLGTLKDDEAIEKWINRIVVNTSLDYLRKNSKIDLIVEEDRVNNIEAYEKEFTLNEIIDELEVDLKTIIVLKYFHGYKIKEIAEILKIPISTVKNKMHKALNILRVEIREEI